MVALTDELRVLDVLEDRLIASLYRTKKRAAITRLSKPRIAVASSGLLGATVATVVLVSSGAAPSAAVAALLRAARASQLVPFSPGESWYARVIETQELPLLSGHVGSLSGPKVRIELHIIRQVWLSANGTETERSVTSSSAATSGSGSSAGRVLPAPATTKSPIDADGRLASPLAPTIPLFAYRQLHALPATPDGLRNIIAAVQRKVDEPEAGRGSSPRSSAAPSKLRAAGNCCSTPAGQNAIGQLTAITWLLAMPVTPHIRAGLYHVAAGLPGVHYVGIVRDSLGRRGTEIAIGDSGAQFAVIFESHTGDLLETKVTFGSAAETQGFGALTQTISTNQVERKR